MLAKCMKATSLACLMGISGGCCDTCGRTTHAHRSQPSQQSDQTRTEHRLKIGLAAVKSSIREQDAAVSSGDVPEFLDAMNWLVRATVLTMSDIDSLPAEKQPAMVRAFMQAGDKSHALYGSSRFRAFEQAASPEARGKIDAALQRLQELDVQAWSSRILKSP